MKLIALQGIAAGSPTMNRAPPTDRLSTLPDSILCDRILSRLNQRDIFLCTCLCSRWRGIWRKVPVLAFDEGILQAAPHMYWNTLDNIFMQHSTDLHKFSLCKEFVYDDMGCSEQWKTYYDKIWEWVGMAASKNVSSLELDNIPIPMSLYSCSDSLEILVLSSDDAFPHVPLSFKGFKALRELWLNNLLIDESVLARFLRLCPNLEKLHVNGCKGISTMIVCNPKLQSMELYLRSRHSFPVLNLHSCDLRTLILTGIQVPMISLVLLANLESLELVRVKVQICSTCWSKGNSLKNLTRLNLTIEHCDMTELGLLGYFLFAAPFLRVINISHPGYPDLSHAPEFVNNITMCVQLGGKTSVKVNYSQFDHV